MKMNKNVSQISLSPKKLATIPNLGEKTFLELYN